MHNGIFRLAVAFLICVPCAVSADTDFRDPTRPYRASVPVTQAPQRFVVNAIIVSDDRRVAIVNGKRVGEGQTIAGATVVEIKKDAIKLDVDGREQILELRRGRKRQ